MLFSAAAATTCGLLVPLAYFHALTTAVLIGHASSRVWLIDGVLLIADPDATLIIAQIVDTPVDIIVDHLTCL